MSMQTDVTAVTLGMSGNAVNARTRVRGLVVQPSTSNGSVMLRDGGPSGAALISVSTVANGEPFNILIPSNGVLFENNVYADLSSASVVVFYG